MQGAAQLDHTAQGMGDQAWTGVKAGFLHPFCYSTSEQVYLLQSLYISRMLEGKIISSNNNYSEAIFFPSENQAA